ncbi:MAG TPA: O-methyltransferase [Candidatus Kapabacteria bacterium]|nr:O-methyltransferase [Candidatus Kapabacteria bacterium]
MSNHHTPVTEDLDNYLNINFSNEDDFLMQLRQEAIAEGIPAINIAPAQARLLQLLIKSIKAKNILEIGTLAGYSSISMARALELNGSLTTVEFEFKHALFAQKKIKEAGLDNIIQVQNSDGKEFLKEFRPNYEFDLIFVDADKPSYKNYLDLATPLLRQGGLFIADNAFAFGYLTNEAPPKETREIKSMQQFNQYFKNHPQYFTSIIPSGDGMIIGVKIA